MSDVTGRGNLPRLKHLCYCWEKNAVLKLAVKNKESMVFQCMSSCCSLATTLDVARSKRKSFGR